MGMLALDAIRFHHAFVLDVSVIICLKGKLIVALVSIFVLPVGVVAAYRRPAARIQTVSFADRLPV